MNLLATPTQVVRSGISNSLDWQTRLSALPDIKGLFGALANRSCGMWVLGLSDEREAARHMPIESKRSVRKARAAVFGNTSGPHRYSIVSDDIEYLTDGSCVLNGNVRPLWRNDAGALCGTRVPTSEPPTVRVRTRTKPTQKSQMKAMGRRDGARLGGRASHLALQHRAGVSGKT